MAGCNCHSVLISAQSCEFNQHLIQRTLCYIYPREYRVTVTDKCLHCWLDEVWQLYRLRMAALPTTYCSCTDHAWQLYRPRMAAVPTTHCSCTDHVWQLYRPLFTKFSKTEVAQAKQSLLNFIQDTLHSSSPRRAKFHELYRIANKQMKLVTYTWKTKKRYLQYLLIELFIICCYTRCIISARCKIHNNQCNNLTIIITTCF